MTRQACDSGCAISTGDGAPEARGHAGAAFEEQMRRLGEWHADIAEPPSLSPATRRMTISSPLRSPPPAVRGRTRLPRDAGPGQDVRMLRSVEPYADVAESYRNFAAYAASDSETFADWALRVANDEEISDWIRSLPAVKQQPNLVFAAARWHGVAAPGPYEALRERLLTDDGSLRATILARMTQTNEVGRLATLLPAFAQISGPLALLEVGASAGLCLYPDRWSYEWRTAAGPVRLGEGAGLACRVSGPAPLPDSLPHVAWRGGIDLNPLDVTDTEEMAWLEQLIWPEQISRKATLARAISIAQADPPALIRGDLLTELPALIDRASAFGTVVVFHSAVIAYLEPEDRSRYDGLMRGLVEHGACRWVSNEGKRVLPSITSTGPGIPEDHETFVLGLDGQMLAQTHGHGLSMRWTGICQGE